jgi:hypothetical protein
MLANPLPTAQAVLDDLIVAEDFITAGTCRALVAAHAPSGALSSHSDNGYPLVRARHEQPEAFALARTVVRSLIDLVRERYGEAVGCDLALLCALVPGFRHTLHADNAMVVCPTHGQDAEELVRLGCCCPDAQVRPNHTPWRKYIAEQTSPDPFNLSLSRNVAARAALEDGGFDYFVFHNVDLIPLEHIDYGPRSFNVAWFLDAGSCKIRRDDLVAANGYDPAFVGWGGEDLDFYLRLSHVGADVRDWHRIPESRRAVIVNLELPALSDEDALAWSRRYFGHRGVGPRFVPYRRPRHGQALERHDKGDFMYQEQRERNDARGRSVGELPGAQRTAHIRDNGLNLVRLEAAAREIQGGVRWLRYRTDEALDRNGPTSVAGRE